MKKHIVRMLAFLLVLILALGILPLGALAATVKVHDEYHTSQNPAWDDKFYGDNVPIDVVHGNTVTIKTSDYDKYATFDNEPYDMKGVFDYAKIPKDTSKKIDTSSSVTFKEDGSAGLLYVPHEHRLSKWICDDTTHWRECRVCKYLPGHEEPFIARNWHSDGDEDRVCDVCGAEIPYHEISVIDSKGGTINVELEEAPYRRKITATVEAAEGYKLKKLHFIKVRDDGSKQEITRRKTDKSTWWTYMPTYDLEVTAEFVRKK